MLIGILYFQSPKYYASFQIAPSSLLARKGRCLNKSQKKVVAGSRINWGGLRPRSGCSGGIMPAYLRVKKYLWQLIALILLPLLLTSPAWAVDYTWVGVAGGGDDTSWTDADNWNPNTSAAGVGPTVGDTVQFNANANITLGADCQVDEATFNTMQVVFWGANSLTTGTLSAIAHAGIYMDNVGSRLVVTGSLDHGAFNVTLGGNGGIEIQGTNNITGAGSIVLSNSVTLFLNGAQTLYLSPFVWGVSAEINLSNAALLTLYQTGGPGIYRGVISGNGSLRTQGNGSLSLSGVSTYNGSTLVAGSCLIINGNDRLPTSTDVTINAGGTFQMVNNQTVASITGNGSIDINAGGSLTVNQAGNTTFSGDITGGAATFTKTGAGTLTLTGTSASDIHVNAGTLVFNGTANQAIEVTLVGGTLMGTGTCNGLTDVGSGYFRPGNSIGTFNASGGLRLGGAGASLAIELGGGAADRVNVIGTVTVAGSALEVTGTPTIGSVFTIINNDLADAVAGTFNGWVEGATVTSGGQDYRISYVGGDGNDVTLTALTGTPPSSGGTPEPEPEPGTDPPAAPQVTQGASPSPVGSLNGTTLTWPHVAGSNFYRVYRAACPTCPKTEVGRVPGTSFTDVSALPGEIYYYFIRTENGGGFSDYSNWMAAWRYEQNPGRAGDFNGDGIMDLLWWDPATGQLSIWYMSHGAVQSVGSPGAGLDISQWLLINTGDFNNDGICDLLWWNPESGVAQAWYMSASASASDGGMAIQATSDTGDITGNVTLSYAGDLNGDGRTDLVWRDYATGQVTVWLMGSDGKPTLNGPPTLADGVDDDGRPGATDSLEWALRGLFDMNADGKADVVWQNASDGRVVVWAMDGVQAIGYSQYQRQSPDNWRIAGLGDLNMDGRGDLVWRNDASGAVQAWLMSGSDSSYEQRDLAMGDNPAAWQVKAVGDFCEHGCDDVYCQNADSGAARITTLNGGEFNPSVE